MKGSCFASTALCLLMCCIGSSPAIAGSKPAELKLHVLVDAPPPCSVKGSAVEFGNVVIKNIDGANYRQPVAYTLNCQNSTSNDLQMQLQGTTGTINGETVLSTGINGFGIRVQNASDHSLFVLDSGHWLPFSIGNLPTLEAVPVKQNGAQLTASEFSATMTMVVDYQ